MKICCVCGARPNFMKIAAVIRAFEAHPSLEPLIVHTGQHYDERLSKVMFDDLELPHPHVDLEVGSASHAVQTAEIMKRFEPVLLAEEPNLVLVVGDVNSTVAASLVAVKLGTPVGHVEAGLRSFDRRMPEEINRIVTDALSQLLFASELSGVDNLRREGVPEECIFFVGNVMIDTLLRFRDRAEGSTVLQDLDLEPGGYAVLTLHRPSNVDDLEVLGGLLDAFEAVQRRLPIVFPAHPRTVGRLAAFGLLPRVEALSRLRLIEPLGYLDSLKLLSHARLLLTDSGGIQEEATILRVPCLTLRENTERPATIASGFNAVVGSRPQDIERAVDRILSDGCTAADAPAGWDGRAGERLAEALMDLGVAGLARLQRRRAGQPSPTSDSR